MTKVTSIRPVIDFKSAAALMAPLTTLVAEAGAAILAISRKAMTIDGKADGSPVTEADLAADHILAEGLARLRPDIPILSEERTHMAAVPYTGSFFLVDPLDGTKEFIAGRNEFTVNLALVTDGVPQLGIVGAPRARIDLARAHRSRRRARHGCAKRDRWFGRADPYPPDARSWSAMGGSCQPLAWR